MLWLEPRRRFCCLRTVYFVLSSRSFVGSLCTNVYCIRSTRKQEKQRKLCVRVFANWILCITKKYSFGLALNAVRAIVQIEKKISLKKSKKKKTIKLRKKKNVRQIDVYQRWWNLWNFIENVCATSESILGLRVFCGIDGARWLYIIVQRRNKRNKKKKQTKIVPFSPTPSFHPLFFLWCAPLINGLYYFNWWLDRLCSRYFLPSAVSHGPELFVLFAFTLLYLNTHRFTCSRTIFTCGQSSFSSHFAYRSCRRLPRYTYSHIVHIHFYLECVCTSETVSVRKYCVIP